MTSWHEFQTRLKTKTGIDQINQDLLYLEVLHWRGVIQSMIAIICHIAERNQALKGHTNVLYDPYNDSFLSLEEFMAHFDSTMKEHLSSIQNKEAKVHYLSSQFQNEIIPVIGDKILDKIDR